ncbi:hypothetical protein T440DRAFT_556053 [Plenodomus tracheiphilus IPT5]|uniref:Uncharacterized protein n=1 Tax=Plenodomus tracheiphilus IPT5 TaxID=1408161 RepID=A0A6A7B140_9PLEO|nr:hypothetical protein T440DRAFT_556053 [Plenodomus tracheiphilus IPT5]
MTLIFFIVITFFSTSITAIPSMAFTPTSDANDLWSRNRYLDIQDPPALPCPRRNAIIEILPRDDLFITSSNSATNAQATISTAISTKTTGDPTFFSSIVSASESTNNTASVETAAHDHGDGSMPGHEETGSAVRDRVEMVVVLLVGVAFAVTLLL